MNGEELKVLWANKNYPQHEGKIAAVEVEMDTRYGGYCETCRYEEEVMVLTFRDAAGLPLGQHDKDTDLASFLKEILQELP